MSLQKIAYFGHGWYLATHERPLVKQPFEAWQHGPVIRVLYDAFKGFGDAPVRTRAKRLDPVTREDTVVAPQLNADDMMFVQQITRRYGPIHAFELSRLTHEVGTPWDQVWNAPGGRVTLGMRIADDLIRSLLC
jgi:uncharacterized phage-associated protein